MSPDPDGRRIGIVGLGRAGSSFATVLAQHGWTVEGLTHDQVDRRTLDALATRVEAVILCVPDGVMPTVVTMFDPARLDSGVVLAHCSGAVGLDVLEPAQRRGSIHPLVSLNGNNPNDLVGAWFALDGDPIVDEICTSVDGRAVHVGDDDRQLYHAAAVVASNHLVALLGQVAALADSIGVPLDAYLDLAAGSLHNVRELGPVAALTGPVSRGDWNTVATHVGALIDHDLGDEIDTYRILAQRAALLAGRDPSTVAEVVEIASTAVRSGEPNR